MKFFRCVSYERCMIMVNSIEMLQMQQSIEDDEYTSQKQEISKTSRMQRM